jgi:hypothetical protein
MSLEGIPMKIQIKNGGKYYEIEEAFVTHVSRQPGSGHDCMRRRRQQQQRA